MDLAVANRVAVRPPATPGFAGARVQHESDQTLVEADNRDADPGLACGRRALEPGSHLTVDHRRWDEAMQALPARRVESDGIRRRRRASRNGDRSRRRRPPGRGRPLARGRSGRGRRGRPRGRVARVGRTACAESEGEHDHCGLRDDGDRAPQRPATGCLRSGPEGQRARQPPSRSTVGAHASRYPRSA